MDSRTRARLKEIATSGNGFRNWEPGGIDGCSLKEVLSREPSFNRWQRLAVGKRWWGDLRGDFIPEQSVLFPVNIQGFFLWIRSTFTGPPDSSKAAERSLTPVSPAGGGYAQDSVPAES